MAQKDWLVESLIHAAKFADNSLQPFKQATNSPYDLLSFLAPGITDRVNAYQQRGWQGALDPFPGQMKIGMAADMGGGSPRFQGEFPPPISGPALGRAYDTVGGTPFSRLKPAQFLPTTHWPAELEQRMAERGWNEDILWPRAAGGGTPEGYLNTRTWTNPFARPNVPAAAPVPGSGAGQTFAPRPGIEGILGAVNDAMDQPRPPSWGEQTMRGPADAALRSAYEAIHGPGSFDGAGGAGKGPVDPPHGSLPWDMSEPDPSRFRYPPLQLGGRNSASIQSYVAENDIRNALWRTPVHEIPYHEWTTTTTDALAAHHQITPAELIRQWEISKPDGGPTGSLFDGARRRGYVSYGDMTIPGRGTFPDRWKQTAPDRWSRVDAPPAMGPNLAGMSEQTMQDFLNKVWGRPMKNQDITRMLPDQLGDLANSGTSAMSFGEGQNMTIQPSGFKSVHGLQGEWVPFKNPKTGEVESWGRINPWGFTQ